MPITRLKGYATSVSLFVLVTSWFIVWATSTTHAQIPMPADSLQGQAQIVEKRKPQRIFLKKPSKAALFSAAFPGLGQLYNKHLWYIRLPIIYGGFFLFGNLIHQNHLNYVEARNNLVYTIAGQQTLISERFRELGFNATGFRGRRDRFRRERDYYIIISLVWYAANIAEAAVTAHLKAFNVDNNLSFHMTPSFDVIQENAVPGITLAIVFH